MPLPLVLCYLLTQLLQQQVALEDSNQLDTILEKDMIHSAPMVEVI